MLSLRGFHLFFILVAIVGADVFGLWAVWDYTHDADPVILFLGVVSLIGGLGLILYAVRLVRSLDAAGIH